MNNPKWLERAASRLQLEQWSLGSLFAQYCRMEGKSMRDLAAELCCEWETVNWLCLARRPRSSRFKEDVKLLCDRFSVNPILLTKIIRRIEVVDELLKPIPDAVNASLMAARDKPKGYE